MLITRECDYAMRAVRALSDYNQKTVKTICDQEHIPLQYAYKILKKLEKSNLVNSIRGAGGGYILSKPLESFTMLDIVMAIEDQLFLNECLNGTFDCPNHTENCGCTAHSEFCRIQRVLERELSSKPISEIFK